MLATVAGVAPGNVDLIAPKGTIDAGDAGIRVSGNINIAANQVLNGGNIAVSGSSGGTPATPPASSGSTSPPPAPPTQTNTNANTGGPTDPRNNNPPPTRQDPLSLITVEVLGYGGGEGPARRNRRRAQTPPEKGGRAIRSASSVSGGMEGGDGFVAQSPALHVLRAPRIR